MEIYGPIKLRGSLVSGTGDPVLTRDTSTFEVGTSSNALPTLSSAQIFVGNGSNVATAVNVTGDVTISNAGVTAIASGVIVNADINASAAIAVSKLAAVTASRALASDASGFITATSVTSTELGYVSGVTSALQTQLNAKQATITGGATTITSSDLTANRALLSSASGKVAVSSVTNTELGYLSGVSSAIQTQFSGKLSATITSAAQGDIIYHNGTAWVNLARGTNGQTLQSTGSSIQWGTPTVNGIPSGGSNNQYLKKNSGTDFDAGWDTLTISDVTDITASAAELNILDGVTVSTSEINFLDNVSANIQTQLDNKLSTSLTTDYILKGVGGVATASTDLPSGTTIGSAVIYRVGGTDVTLADGGTGASLADPNADRIMFWDDSAGQVTWLTAGTGLTITGTTISVTGTIVGSTGSTDNAILRADGTGGSTAQGSAASVDDNGNLTIGTASIAGDKTITAIGSAGTERLKVLSAFGQLKISDVAGSGSGSGLVFETTFAGAGTMTIGSTTSFSPNLTSLAFQVNATSHSYRKLDTTVWYSISASSTQITHTSERNAGADESSLDNIFSTSNGVTNGTAGSIYLNPGTGAGSGTDGNVGFFSTSGSFGSGEKVIAIANATTNASTNPTNGIVIHARDSSDGSTNATLALYLEQAPEASGTFTQTHRLKIWVNGTEYYLPLDTV